MLTQRKKQKLFEKVESYLRKQYMEEFTNEDAKRLFDFCMDEVDEEIPYPFHYGDIINVAAEFELKYL